MGEWLIKWEKRGRSGPVHDSFLWQNDRVYVMDNHRLALWCWWQHLDNSPKWHFLHIDRHYDALWQQFRPWLNSYNPSHKLNLNSFRQAKVSDAGEKLELYRWDTITSALSVINRKNFVSWTFATANEGDPLKVRKLRTLNPWELPAHLHSMAESTTDNVPSVIDIDIDYFTCRNAKGTYKQVFSNQYIRELGSALNRGLSNNKFGVITIALSPTTTGSWKLAESLCWLLLQNNPSLSDLRAGSPSI